MPWRIFCCLVLLYEESLAGLVLRLRHDNHKTNILLSIWNPWLLFQIKVNVFHIFYWSEVSHFKIIISWLLRPVAVGLQQQLLDLAMSDCQITTSIVNRRLSSLSESLKYDNWNTWRLAFIDFGPSRQTCCSVKYAPSSIHAPGSFWNIKDLQFLGNPRNCSFLRGLLWVNSC